MQHQGGYVNVYPDRREDPDERVPRNFNPRDRARQMRERAETEAATGPGKTRSGPDTTGGA